MAIHRAAGSCCLLLALTFVLLSGWFAPPQAEAKTRYAAIVGRGQKGKWPYCAVTGWKPAIFPCPPRTQCKVSWVDGGRSASNCYWRPKIPKCSLKNCAWWGADTICRLRLLSRLRTTCGKYATRIKCSPSVVCSKIYKPVCDSNMKSWSNLCFLEKGLCAEGFAKAYGPVLGNC